MSDNTIKTPSRTDWERLAAMGDEDIDYSDIPPLDEAFFQHAQLYIPQSLSIKLDHDIYAWFARQGQDYPMLINRILRQYIERQQQHLSKHKRTTTLSRSS